MTNIWIKVHFVRDLSFEETDRHTSDLLLCLDHETMDKNQ